MWLNRLIMPMALCAFLAINGCASLTSSNFEAKALPSITGVDTSTVNMFVDSETGKVLLTGQVNRGIEKITIEKYLREELGYTEISNQLTSAL